MITSLKNNQIKNIINLQKKARERRAQRLFVIEGIRAFKEVPPALIKAVYYCEGFYEESATNREIIEKACKINPLIEVEEVAKSVFSSMSDTVTPQGVMAVVCMPEFSLSDVLSVDRIPQIVLLETLQDPGNLGTIIRTAEGSGTTGIIMNQTTVDIYSPKVVRSTMGSIFRVPHIIVEDLTQTVELLKTEYGVEVYAAHLKGEKFYDEFDFKKPLGFMIGNEGNGLSDELSSCASSYLKIPMEGQLESLNASVAASILMYEAHRQRR